MSTRHSRFQDASVARRMSWASKRRTTRTEDIAYCLIGLFDVNMPLVYDEGRKAFLRQQQAIISQTDDESIFVWLSKRVSPKYPCPDLRNSEDFTKQEKPRGLPGVENQQPSGMPADSPSDFANAGHVRPIFFARKRPPLVFSSRGLEIHCAYTYF